MMLNAEQILERNILKLENSKGKPAQIGYDLSVKEIKQVGWKQIDENTITSSNGKVLKDKTNLADTTIKKTSTVDEKIGWNLSPGYYEVTFWEGCKIPNNLVGLIRQRSSMLRNGSLLHSSVFDPGFETDEMGSFIAVFNPIFIEKDARIGQIYFHECEPVNEVYNGQFQFDKQRK